MLAQCMLCWLVWWGIWCCVEPGNLKPHARVYYVDHSRADDKPAWRFDHGGAGASRLGWHLSYLLLDACSLHALLVVWG
jgi:hypothetical protein